LLARHWREGDAASRLRSRRPKFSSTATSPWTVALGEADGAAAPFTRGICLDCRPAAGWELQHPEPPDRDELHKIVLELAEDLARGIGLA
jgi:hypothetical protein